MIVAIIGAGNGGQAVAGSLALAGHRVRLHDIDPSQVEPIAKRGGITAIGHLVRGFASVEYAGTDVAAAVLDAELVMVVVPGAAQAEAVEALAPHLGEGVPVVLHPGCTGGALECARTLRASPVAETDAFLYACRLIEPGTTQIMAIKSQIRVGVTPAAETGRVVAQLRRLIPQAQPAASVLETSLANMNAMLHVGPMLANAGRVENRDASFEFYGEGITPSVAQLVERVDEERLDVCGALGVAALTLREWIEQTYGVRGESLHDAIQRLNRTVYASSPAPATLEHRYLTEDVPAGFVPLEALGHAAGLPMETVGALVTIASAALDRDLRVSGRTAERMGLEGLDANGLRRLVSN